MDSVYTGAARLWEAATADDRDRLEAGRSHHRPCQHGGDGGGVGSSGGGSGGSGGAGAAANNADTQLEAKSGTRDKRR